MKDEILFGWLIIAVSWLLKALASFRRRHTATVEEINRMESLLKRVIFVCVSWKARDGVYSCLRNNIFYCFMIGVPIRRKLFGFKLLCGHEYQRFGILFFSSYFVMNCVANWWCLILVDACVVEIYLNEKLIVSLML